VTVLFGLNTIIVDTIINNVTLVNRLLSRHAKFEAGQKTSGNTREVWGLCLQMSEGPEGRPQAE